MKLSIQKLREGAMLPQRATAGSAGYDLCACLEEPLLIPAGETRPVPTGLAIALPSAEMAAFIYARSGLATKKGLAPANCVGVVDSDYRGELFVPLHNHSGEDYTVTPGERIAQMILAPVLLPELCEVPQLDETLRGTGGFGSTGK